MMKNEETHVDGKVPSFGPRSDQLEWRYFGCVATWAYMT